MAFRSLSTRWPAARRTAATTGVLPRAPPTPILRNSIKPLAAGIHHHFCKLAIIETNGTITDCRPIFPPLTELISLFYVSGDGQEALPGQTLAKPIQVGVANGKWPVIGARVNFHITGGSGNLASGSSSGSDITIVTDNLGIASCNWTLDQSNPSQQVEARLADGSHLPVRFNAQLAQPGGLEPGIHVKGINVANAPLLNDTNVTVTQLVNGIRVDCDDDLFQPSVRDKPVCMVTLDMPFPFNSADMQLWGSSVIGFTKLVLEAEVNSDNASIFWRPSREATAWLLGRLFQMMTELKRGERVLARLTLTGNFIWAQRDPDLYLDGEVFGARAATGGTTDIKLPSGDGRRGGDLEMWFWLIAPPARADAHLDASHAHGNFSNFHGDDRDPADDHWSDAHATAADVSRRRRGVIRDVTAAHRHRAAAAQWRRAPARGQSFRANPQPASSASEKAVGGGDR